VTIWNKQISY